MRTLTMRTLMVDGAGRRLPMNYGRYERYRTIRKRRRRLGFAWAIVAAMTLLGAWDVAGRMDELAYNALSLR